MGPSSTAPSKIATAVHRFRRYAESVHRRRDLGPLAGANGKARRRVSCPGWTGYWLSPYCGSWLFIFLGIATTLLGIVEWIRSI